MSEIAWAGGLFEGEGTVTALAGSNRRGGRRFQARIGMTDLEPLRRFHAAVGLGRIYGPYGYKDDSKRSRAGHAPYWVWTVHDKAGVEQLYALLRPWLSARRRAAFDSAVSSMSAVRAQGVRIA